MTGEHPSGPDCPRAGLFRRYEDALGEALFRADLTGRRYRVRFDPGNQWWGITESAQRHRPVLSDTTQPETS
jgi:hypothetical protein